jgi:hypothetical protein
MQVAQDELFKAQNHRKLTRYEQMHAWCSFLYFGAEPIKMTGFIRDSIVKFKQIINSSIAYKT